MKRFKNKGFSLVELIVTVAIMGVLATVLTPMLFRYVEESRAEKDNSAMEEVVHTIEVAMADQNVYDEILYYAIRGNASCYANKGYVGNASAKEVLGEDYLGSNFKFQDEPAHYYYRYNDSARTDDEKSFAFDGLMYGVTITFETSGGSSKSEAALTNATVNAVAGSVTKNNSTIGTLKDSSSATDIKTCTLNNMQKPNSATTYLYDYLRTSIGNSVKLTSQAYRNSDYTVFISLGSVTKAGEFNTNAVEVYGQWSGTNLPKK